MRELIESNLTTEEISNEFVKSNTIYGVNFFKIQTNLIKYSIVNYLTPNNPLIKEIQIYNSLNFIKPKTIFLYSKTIIFSTVDTYIKVSTNDKAYKIVNCKNVLIQIKRNTKVTLEIRQPIKKDSQLILLLI